MGRVGTNRKKSGGARREEEEPAVEVALYLRCHPSSWD
jgi:hypothetical protein